MIVVSDTSPVLNLARIKRLELLRTLYQEVLVPPAVYDELRAAATRSEPPLNVSFAWLTVSAVKDRGRIEEMRADLDLGEAEAIVLAIERRADLLLVDERRGRRTATASGLAVTGPRAFLDRACALCGSPQSARRGMIPLPRRLSCDAI